MDDLLFDLPDLRDRDFTEHNAASRALWEVFKNGTHERVPVRMGCNPRVLMLDPRYNRRGVTYEEYMDDPEVMGQAVLEWQYWERFLLPGDHEKGLPEHWTLMIDFENHYDAAWFGCPVHYREGQVPDTAPILTDGAKRILFDRGVPDPFAGEWAERCLRFLEYYQRRCAEGWTFLGVPVKAPTVAPFMGFDGVFTAMTSLRGSTAACLDFLDDAEYARELLKYVHESVVARMKAWRDRFGIAWPQDGYGAADDAIQFLSTEAYREFVLPLHRRLFDSFASDKDRGMHLCGNAQRHFVTIRDELGVTSFDTGFPVDFAAFRRDLGPDVQIAGGPAAPLFVQDDAAPVVAETERILGSGVLEGGRVILREGNNLPPTARLHVCEAFYEAGKRSGRFDSRRPGHPQRS